MKEAILYFLLSLFAIGTAYFGYQTWSKSDWVHPGHVDELLSDSTRVFSAIIASERAISDSLSQVSLEASGRIRAKQERIQTLTTLTGRVRTVRDTVEVVREVKIPVEPDTITFTQTFSDSLFLVTSELRFRDGSVSNYLDLEQLRDLRIDITLTERQGLIMTYVTSPDFELNEYRTLQLQPEVQRNNGWIWYSAGLATGLLIFIVVS